MNNHETQDKGLRSSVKWLRLNAESRQSEREVRTWNLHWVLKVIYIKIYICNITKSLWGKFPSHEIHLSLWFRMYFLCNILTALSGWLNPWMADHEACEEHLQHLISNAADNLLHAAYGCCDHRSEFPVERKLITVHSTCVHRPAVNYIFFIIYFICF